MKENIVTKWNDRKIVAWDGEGANLEDGTHIYNLLANSNDAHIINPEGIPTRDAFDFMIENSSPKDINVIFSGGYDVNMILRDIDPIRLGLLWRTGSCTWGDYRISYTPRKKFTVGKVYKTKDNKLGINKFVLWDVFGYFQSSFVVACHKWLGDNPILSEVDFMKRQRDVFTVDDIGPIRRYNAIECQLLVALMTKFFESMDEAGITLTRYDGAGSIAAALFKEHKITDHFGSPPTSYLKMAQYAYAGGRIEAVKVGNAENTKVYRYDINSAYPYSQTFLRSYKKATYVPSLTYDGDPYSLVHVEWEFPSGHPFYPFWYRQPDGTILYPPEGEGIYYGFEVNAAREFFGEGITIIGVWKTIFNNGIYPFSFMSDKYEIRRMFKTRGSMAHEGIKLGMNSAYGKLAQQVGGRNGQPPQFHNIVMAGLITSMTRAQLFRAAMQQPESVIAFATDAIITTKKLDLDIGNHLGGWSAEEFEGITIVQPGVYWLKTRDGWADKYRGFDKNSLKREEIVEKWRIGEQYYPAKLTRFVGLGSAVSAQSYFEKWRTWDTQVRNLNLIPTGKRLPSKDEKEREYYRRLCLTEATHNASMMISAPYPITWMDTEEGARPISVKQAQLFQDELEDSYY